jgi:lycopene beta-cyclase
MNPDTTFDYIIVGAGAAGLQVAMAFISDDHFRNKSMLIIDKSDKKQNDKTWSFWEKGSGQWDELVRHSWGRTLFRSMESELDLDIYPYRYKSIRAEDFYRYALKKISESDQIRFVQDEVLSVTESKPVEVKTTAGTFQAGVVFDSRLPKGYPGDAKGCIQLLQHFTGWEIETGYDFFDPSRFTIMDFTVQRMPETAFTYVLPFSERRALVEFTLFTPDLIRQEEYERMIKKYIAEKLELADYIITEKEYGVIPMTDYPFHRHHSAHVKKVGTAGGWVRPSTGYSFRNATKYAQQIVENLKSGRDAAAGIAKGRHRKYDSIFLDVLYRNNELGPSVFSDMYRKNPPDRIFRFLDGESSLIDDLRIISSFDPKPFRQALGRNWRKLF